METPELVKAARDDSARKAYETKMARINANDQKRAAYEGALAAKEAFGMKIDELERFHCTASRTQIKALAAGNAVFLESLKAKKNSEQILSGMDKRIEALEVEEGA